MSRATDAQAVGGVISVAAVLASCLVIVPVLAGSTPPLHDYPFHLARLDILTRYDASTYLQAHYQFSSLLLPNVLMDVIGLAMAVLMPVESAGRALVAIMLVVQVSGAFALHRALWKRLSPWPLISVLVAFNAVLLIGFLNYLLGIGIALWALASRQWMREHPVWQRLLSGTVGALLVYFSHIVAFGLYALALGVFVLVEFREQHFKAWLSRAIADTVPLLIAVLLFLISATAGARGLALFTGLEPYMHWKLQWLLTPFRFGDAVLDVSHVVTLLAVWGGLCVIARFRVRFELVALVATGGLAYFAAPFFAMSGAYLDFRVPIGLAFLAIPLIDVTPRAGRSMALLTACLLLAASVRVGTMAVHWHRAQAVLADVRASLRLLPEHAVVFTASQQPAPNFVDPWTRWSPPIKHAISFASLGRDLFVPATFAHTGQQPIVPRPAWRMVYDLQSNNPPYARDVVALSDILRRYRQAVTSERVFVLVLEPDRTLDLLTVSHALVAAGARHALLELTSD